MTIRLREIAPADWELWRTLRLEALRDSPDAYGRTFEEEREFDEGTWRGRIDGQLSLVAEIDGRGVGIAACRIDQDDRSRAWIFTMWVRLDARRGGVATALLDRALAWARRQGVDRAVLHCTETNDGARRLYEQAGFTDTGERAPLREGSPIATIVMQRALGAT